MPARRSLAAALAAAAALSVPAAAAAPADAWSRGAPVAIRMTDRGFAPRRIVLRAGRPYVLHFANPSGRGHNFSAPAFFAHARVSPRDQAWVAKNEVALAPGERAAIHIVAPTTPGARYAFRSTRIEDAASDMKGAIYVR